MSGSTKKNKDKEKEKDKDKEKEKDLDEEIKFDNNKDKPPQPKPLFEKSDPVQKLTEGILKATEKLDAAYTRLEKVEKQLNLVPEKPKASEIPYLYEFDLLVTSSVPPLVLFAVQISDLLEEQVDKLYTALAAIRSLLMLTNECKKNPNWDGLCAPIAKLIAEIVDISEKNKGTLFSDHLAFVSKAAPCMAWIASATPALHIQQFKTPTESLINKFMKEHKARYTYVSFASSFISFMKAMFTYVSKYHPNGLAWNQNGKDAPTTLKFPKRGYPYMSSSSLPPQLFNENGRWYCTNQTGPKVITTDGDKKQTCYIRDCENAKITVKGKLSILTIDGCWYSKVTIESTTQLNVINSFCVVLVCHGIVPNINISKTHRCVIRPLDRESTSSMEVTSSACSKVVVEDLEGSSYVPGSVKVKIVNGGSQVQTLF